MFKYLKTYSVYIYTYIKTIKFVRHTTTKTMADNYLKKKFHFTWIFKLNTEWCDFFSLFIELAKNVHVSMYNF